MVAFTPRTGQMAAHGLVLGTSGGTLGASSRLARRSLLLLAIRDSSTFLSAVMTAVSTRLLGQTVVPGLVSETGGGTLAASSPRVRRSLLPRAPLPFSMSSSLETMASFIPRIGRKEERGPVSAINGGTSAASSPLGRPSRSRPATRGSSMSLSVGMMVVSTRLLGLLADSGLELAISGGTLVAFFRVARPWPPYLAIPTSSTSSSPEKMASYTLRPGLTGAPGQALAIGGSACRKRSTSTGTIHSQARINIT